MEPNRKMCWPAIAQCPAAKQRRAVHQLTILISSRQSSGRADLHFGNRLLFFLFFSPGQQEFHKQMQIPQTKTKTFKNFQKLSRAWKFLKVFKKLSGRFAGKTPTVFKNFQKLSAKTFKNFQWKFLKYRNFLVGPIGCESNCWNFRPGRRNCYSEVSKKYCFSHG